MYKLTIDPNTQAIILYFVGAVGAVCAVLAGLTPDIFPSYINHQVGADIIKTAGLISALIGGVGGTMSVFSSNKPGIVAKMMYKHEV